MQKRTIIGFGFITFLAALTWLAVPVVERILHERQYVGINFENCTVNQLNGIAQCSGKLHDASRDPNILQVTLMQSGGKSSPAATDCRYLFGSSCFVMEHKAALPLRHFPDATFQRCMLYEKSGVAAFCIGRTNGNNFGQTWQKSQEDRFNGLSDCSITAGCEVYELTEEKPLETYVKHP